MESSVILTFKRIVKSAKSIRKTPVQVLSQKRSSSFFLKKNKVPAISEIKKKILRKGFLENASFRR